MTSTLMTSSGIMKSQAVRSRLRLSPLDPDPLCGTPCVFYGGPVCLH